ncbi:MAG: DNA cytosine methyltransferase [Phycisphaerae bacterium]|nr:DNA cytosine methyltransferase [Phycisphaerae bacterium]
MDRRTACVRGRIEQELIVDNFAGAGGASLGIEAALGRCVDIAINHSKRAVEIHGINHPHTRHLCEDVWDVDPLAATGGRPVGLAWFSPDCKHFSKAKGGKPLSKRIRGLAWIVIRWAKAVKPRVIILENVEEFVTWGPLDDEGKIVKEKKGQTFLRWVSQLRSLGYEVEHRELVAADYGVPTTRKRFFLVARCDGVPITWPERTHAPRKKALTLHLKPWRSAAECIDWSLPCPSIFERKRPLAEATMRRIARGIMRYVIDAKEPFIVTCNHAGATGGLRSADEPMRTVTGSRDANGVVIPHVTKFRTGATGSEAGDPMPTITAGNGNPARPAGAGHALGEVEAFLSKYHGDNGETNGRATSPSDPISTLDTQNRFALAAAFLQRFNFGETEHVDPRNPMQTITAGGNHVADVRAFLVKYYSHGGQDQDARNPLHTITDRARMGLVSVYGVDYQITDIGLRMLQPSELLRAQFGRFADEYILTGTKADQVAAIGNSVCPELAEAIVRSNFK